LGFRPLNSLTQRDGKKQKVADNREGYQQKGIEELILDDRIMSQYLLGVSKANVLLA